MQRYLAFRLFYSIIILALLSVLVFFMVRLLPGDPIRAAMQSNVDLTDKSIVEDIRAQYGLDKPVTTQYVIWLRDFFRGNWGKSIGSGDQVLDMFLRRLPVTLELFVGATFWAWIVGFPVGTISALKRNSALDVFLTSNSILFVAAPPFWVAIMLIYAFAVKIPIFPPSGYVPFADDPLGNLQSVFLPSFVMGISVAGYLARYVRSTLLEVLSLDFIRTARAKGLKEKAVVIGHAAKPAMIPIVTIIGLSWGHMVGGSFIIEFMFAVPGLGRMGVDAIFGRDFPVIQAVLIATAVNVQIMNLLVDLTYGYLDPRVRVHN
jgi:peptide/nickel transport system permease protein